jgi:molybdenum ABC transporter molybdate-binding protein
MLKRALLVLFLLAATSAHAKDLHVLAPKSIRGIMIEISKFFEKNNPDWQVQLRIGTSVALSNLVIQGTPADVFLLNEEKPLEALQEKQLASRVKPFLADDAVIVASAASKLEISDPAKLVFPELKGVALYEETDPVGKASRDYLKKIGILDSIQSKVGIQTSTKDVLKSLQDGITDWSILYQSDVLHATGIKVLYQIPEKDFAPQFYYLGTVATSTQKEGIRKYLATIHSTIIQKFFENAGYRIVK